MPTIGVFHAKFWRARANLPAAPGTTVGWMYPQVQAAVLMCALPWSIPWAALGPVRHQVRWLWSLVKRLWWVRSVAQQADIDEWIVRVQNMGDEQRAVLERVYGLFAGAAWPVARDEVRACATSPKFHQPEQWVGYSRAVKSNPGQAQNIWRHMKVVFAIQAATGASNTDAHLLAELAYQGMAAQGRPERVIVHHAHI